MINKLDFYLIIEIFFNLDILKGSTRVMNAPQCESLKWGEETFHLDLRKGQSPLF